VTWLEATAFATACKERLRREGKLAAGWEFRLPSEAQWEYACRAGTTTAYCSGEGEGSMLRVGWCDGNTVRRQSRLSGWLQSLPVIGNWIPGNGPRWESKPAGEKEGNKFGLHDMHGNVSEWCEDMYGAYEEDSAVDPTGPRLGPGIVVRGGFWACLATECRSARRARWFARDRDRTLGVRVCLVPSPAAAPVPHVE
jgi:formylglycine-generating enzyme required for sulfatase activity